MPRSVIERELPGDPQLSAGDLKRPSQKSCSVLAGMGPEIQWRHSYVTDNKIYCVCAAPNEGAIHEHTKRGGFPGNRISEARNTIDPGTATR